MINLIHISIESFMLTSISISLSARTPDVNANDDISDYRNFKLLVSLFRCSIIHILVILMINHLK